LVSLLALTIILVGNCVEAGTVCSNNFDFTARANGVFVNNQRFYIKGLSWFGFETDINVVHGLWARSYNELFDFIKNNGFNALRLPFYLELILNDNVSSGIDYNYNPDLRGISSLAILDKIVAAAAERNILVMLDLHCFKAGTLAQDGLWYDSTHPESLVLQGWDKLIGRYAKTWNVIAFDLKNEPHASTWGTGNQATDWNLAAQRIGNHILANGGDKFLIFVEGTSNSPSCNPGCFWGEDLLGVTTNPVNLTSQSKLVYSPHCYGPSVYDQPYFSDPNYPRNLPDIWQAHYGFVPKLTGQPIVVGEWGGQYTGRDKTWQDAYVAWLSAQGYVDTFYWCLNPNSGDTGGLLGNDWVTPETAKLDIIRNLIPNPTVFSRNSQGQYCVTNA